MEKKNTLFKNTIYKSILSIVNIVVPIIIGPYIMRLLDVDLYGMYNRVFADFQMFLAFAGFGVYTLGVREISKIIIEFFINRSILKEIKTWSSTLQIHFCI